MASSDDESEELLQSVSNYHLEDENFEPVSFCVLPIQWSEEDRPVGKQIDVSLRGSADKGLQKVFKQVVAWKYDISSKNPEVYVLSKENVWIKLQQPKKSFEETIRSVLVTVQCLHFVKKNPEISGKPMWDHLSKAFSWYDLLPNENDLMDHITLIREAVKRNTDLEKSKFLHALLEEKPGKRKSYGEDAQPTKKTRFMVDDDDDGDDMYEDEIAERDDSDDIFDSVCAICDNGGELVCCEGICFRSFHATDEAGSESLCESLGFSEGEVDAIDFKCENCLHQQHQCFVCGKLGSSNQVDAEVSKCLNATCGFFYHPHCVSKLIHRNDKAAAEELEKRMDKGERITCPIHKCCVCGQGENREVRELQFAVCRRCPRSYHKKCLPKEIAFEDDEANGFITRAWENLLPSRILIYCLDHEIDEEIGTPIRTHIVFPGPKKTDVKKKKVSVEEKKIKQTTPFPRNAEKVASKEINIIPRDSIEGRNAIKPSKQNDRSASAMKVSNNKHVEKKSLPGSDVPRKVKADNASKKSSNDNAKFIPVDADKDTLRDKLFGYMQKSGLVKPGKVDRYADEHSKPATIKAETMELSSVLPPLDAKSQMRILSLMKDAASSISLDDVKKKYDVPSTHAHSSVDKFMTEGKVQGAVEAARTALRKLEEGCSMEDAAAVCNKHVLKQLFKWRNQLRGYLAPFQHGMRYTSFGRHFTRLDKLQMIVDRLHWYVKDGDMIVDFCCGANDFSILMKKKLEETGKKCSYKNYDIMPAKNDFCYEKRDWMTVEPKELPSGSRLIMGLNPPFGIQAQSANKFINKALEFNPKLLILIAPPETERLDEKKTPYDLVWEDDQVLSGKSFYLPGSVDVNDKQMEQWNVTPPLLSLWSYPDWSSKHLEIAEKHGHNSTPLENSDFRKNSSGTICLEHPLDDQEQNDTISSLSKNNLPIQASEPEGSAIGTAVKEGSSSARRGTSSGSSREKEERGGNIPEEEKGKDITNKRNSERSSVSSEVVQNSEPGGLGNPQPLRVETPYGGTLGSFPNEPGSVYRSWPSEPNSGWNINQMFLGPRRGNLTDDDEYRSSSYMMEQEENKRESELRARLRLYGQQDYRYDQMGQLAPSYGHHQYGSVGEPVYRMSNTPMALTSSMPTMKRYEPKLDELNYTRVSGLGPAGPGFKGVPGPYPMDFAPGPHPASYPHHESAGWINE